MTALTECRLLCDPPRPGAWNMAVDEMLLEWSAEQGGCCWRFYRWEQPTLSLGYFQRYEHRQQHPPSRHCPAVRRLTGGGAIVHDAELTYSLVIPSGHRLAAQRGLLYEAVHASLIEALAEAGIAAALCRPAGRGAPTGEPFLCFQRRAPGDVLLGQAKVAGSAQRRRRGAVLQHGSVLLRRSAAAPELATLEELSGRAFTAEGLAAIWLPKVSDRLGLVTRPQPLSPQEQQRAAVLLKTRYSQRRWTEKRGR
jgi:lipoate-protein ligase A